MATNKLPRHYGYPKEVGEILKTDLGKFRGTGIATNKLPRLFGYPEEEGEILKTDLD